MEQPNISFFRQIGKLLVSAFLTIGILIICFLLLFKFYLDWMTLPFLIVLISVGIWCICNHRKVIGWGIFLGLGIAVTIIILALSGLNYVR